MSSYFIMYHLFIGELIESNSSPHMDSHAPKFYLGFTPFYMPHGLVLLLSSFWSAMSFPLCSPACHRNLDSYFILVPFKSLFKGS